MECLLQANSYLDCRCSIPSNRIEGIIEHVIQ